MDFLLSNLDRLVSIFALLVVSSITIFNVSLNQQNWIKTFSGSMTLLLLPIITYSITSVISGNIALSLGMIGALSIVRFRNPVRSSFELVIFFFMITLGICAAVDLRWLLILGLSCNFIIFFVYFINTILARYLSTTLFMNSFSEGNSSNTLEISSKEPIQLLISNQSLISYSSSDDGFIYRLASQDMQILKEIAVLYDDSPTVDSLTLRAG
jgi:hypothetical protein